MALKKFAQENNIRLLDFPELDEIDELTALGTVKDNFEKISNVLPEFEMTIQSKEFGQKNKKGARKQYEVHCRIIAPKRKIVSTSTEWNFISALQESCKSLKLEVMKAVAKK